MQEDLEATLNCGVGMVALTPPDDVAAALDVLEARDQAWVAGEVGVADGASDVQGGRVTLVGQHPGW